MQWCSQCPYPYFKTAVETCGGVCHYADCDPRSSDIDIASLSKAMRRGGRRLKALMLCSPCNPSGRVIQKELLDDIVCLVYAHCKKHKTRVWILVDHTYWNITWGDVKLPPLFECYDDAVVVSSFSKDLGLAGERLGFSIVNPRSDEAGSLAATLTENNVSLGELEFVASAIAVDRSKNAQFSPSAGNICPPSVIQHAMAKFLSVPGRFDAAVGEYRQNYKVYSAPSSGMPDSRTSLRPTAASVCSHGCRRGSTRTRSSPLCGLGTHSRCPGPTSGCLGTSGSAPSSRRDRRGSRWPGGQSGRHWTSCGTKEATTALRRGNPKIGGH